MTRMMGPRTTFALACFGLLALTGFAMGDTIQVRVSASTDDD